MKISTTPVVHTGFAISVIGHSGSIVGTRSFATADDVIARLSYWDVDIDEERGSLRVVDVRRYRGLREFGDYPSDGHGWLYLNVVVSGCCIAPETVLRQVRRHEEALVSRRPRIPFRDGVVEGTGKWTPYRYFRRKLASYPSRREATCLADDEAPRVRAARSVANLPDARDDHPRCRQRSWKKTRRHQWKP